MTDYDCIVIGAGYAGLYAARALTQQGAHVCVIEAQNRVGGRAESEHRGADFFLEFGAVEVSTAHTRLCALAALYGKELRPLTSDGAHLSFIRNRVARYRPGSAAPSLFAHACLVWGRYRLNALAQKITRISARQGWRTVNGERWLRGLDAVTLAAYLGKVVPSSTARALLQAELAAVVAGDASEVSLLHALNVVRTAGNLMDALPAFVTANSRETRLRFADGAESLAKAMANEIGRGRIVLESPVLRIQHTLDSVTVHTVRASYTCKHAILAIAPAAAASIEFSPMLAPLPRERMQRVQATSTIQYHALYTDPFWRKDGLSGNVVSDQGPCRLVFDASPASASAGVLAIRVTGKDALDLTNHPREARKRAVLEALGAYFGSKALTPYEFLERILPTGKFALGCSGSFTSVGARTMVSTTGDFDSVGRHADARIHWATESMAEAWTGTLEGALCAGERAANDVWRELH